MFTVICSLFINMNSSAIQKCLSSNGLSPGQTQGCSHPCVMLLQRSESELAWFPPQSRGSRPSRPTFQTPRAPTPSQLPCHPAGPSSAGPCCCRLQDRGRACLELLSMEIWFLHCPCALSFILTSCVAALVGSDGLKTGGCILPHRTSRHAVARGRFFQDGEGSSARYLSDTVPSHRRR